MDQLGEIVKRRRTDLGLSQSELAEAAGVHLRQIRRYESGEQQPVLPVAVPLANALGGTVNELAGPAPERVAARRHLVASWQPYNAGLEIIATQPVGIAQHGTTIQI